MHAVEAFEVVLVLLVLVLLLHWAADRLRWPPSAALLIGGGALAFVPGLPVVSLDPQLALVLFLPPLLFDGAYSISLSQFRRNLSGILALAIGTVVVTTLTVGLVTHWLFPGLPWAACFTLGAIVSPPDAVSARAVLKGVHLPRRLDALLEGESLLNDATGLILFRFAVAATLSGVFSLGQAVQSFVIVAIGGAIVGYLIGKLAVLAIRRIDHRTLLVVANALLCWGAYLAGEALHVSGVIAVVAAGLVLGWHQHTLFSADVRLVRNSFWLVLVFMLEAMVFMLIGFSLRGVLDRMGGITAIPMPWVWTVLAVIATVTLTRVAWVFGSDLLVRWGHAMGWLKTRPLGWRQATVLSWAGMRGVVTLAVPLSLPADMPGRDLMIICAFSVIFVTVIAQGWSLGWLIRNIRPVDRDPAPALSMAGAEGAMARARFACIESHAYDEEGELIHPMLLEDTRRRLTYMEKYEADAAAAMERLKPHFDLILVGIAAARQELIRLHRAGLIEDAVLHELERDLDVEEMAMVFQRGT